MPLLHSPAQLADFIEANEIEVIPTAPASYPCVAATVGGELRLVCQSDFYPEAAQNQAP